MQQIKITPSVTQRGRTVNQYLSDINHCPMVSPEEESELAAQIRAGDEEAFRRLVEANLRFVVSVAKQYQGHGLELCDLINEGNVGLMKAARKFDPSRGFKFISYAVWWIRQGIIQGISDQGRTIRLPLNQISTLNRLAKARAEFLQDNEREPTDAELAELTDLSPDKIGDSLRSDAAPLSFDTPFGEDGDGTLLDVVPDNMSPAADASLWKESLRSDLVEVLDTLAPREREILRLSYGIGCQETTLEEIGERFSLTRERVRQLKERAIKKIARSPARSRLAQYL